MVNENKLYTAYITGTSQDGNKEYERVIITKWKDRTDESSEEGSNPQNTRLWIEKEIKCHVER